MIWAHSGRMHWTCHDVVGLMIDVRITSGITHLAVIDANTGEITRTATFNHPLDAMKDAKQYVVEVKHVETRQDERKTPKSESNSSGAEETCTISEGNRLPC